MAAWFAAKRQGNYPVIGAVSENGELLGFASYGPFRPWPAYKYSVEHSVYVAAAHRGQGIGKWLLERPPSPRPRPRTPRAGRLHRLPEMPVSVALHRALGFEYAGTIRQVGFKFGRWLDLDLYQMILKTPQEPIDG